MRLYPDLMLLALAAGIAFWFAARAAAESADHVRPAGLQARGRAMARPERAPGTACGWAATRMARVLERQLPASNIPTTATTATSAASRMLGQRSWKALVGPMPRTVETINCP